MVKKESAQTKSGRRIARLGACAAALPLTLSIVHAADAPSRVDALVSFEFANEYLTPRGMIVHDKGLTFQPLVLGFINVYKGDKDDFINDFTIVPGVWNDFSTSGVSQHPPFGSKPTTSWVEIDPIAGISTTFAKNFTLSVTYTAFNMQILDIGTSQHLDTKLAFDDSSYLGAFSLHPYVEFWQELYGKATAADVPYAVNPLGLVGKGSGPGSSFYFEVGVDPSYTFKDSGIKIEAPLRMLLPDKNFYGEYYGSSSTVGLYELGLKGTVPMKFMPEGYGHWSFHAGFRYMHFEDVNLADMQQFNAPGKAVRNNVQGYAGISVFF